MANHGPLWLKLGKAGDGRMETLGDRLPKEMARVRDRLLPLYDAIPTGMYVATMMRKDLDRAAKAMIDGDIVEMVRVCKSLMDYKA
jgi:hypothetical protein